MVMRAQKYTWAGSLPALLLLGCSPGRDSPTDVPIARELPPPPPLNPSQGYVWGHVVDASGLCLSGAAVEIVAGPGTGRKVAQQVPCDAWSYAIGYEFRDLPLGASVRLRASTVGYRPQERDLVTQSGGAPFQFEMVRE